MVRQAAREDPPTGTSPGATKSSYEIKRTHNSHGRPGFRLRVALRANVRASAHDENNQELGKAAKHDVESRRLFEQISCQPLRKAGTPAVQESVAASPIASARSKLSEGAGFGPPRPP